MILAKPFQLRTPLGSLLSEDDAALQTLTHQQFHILRAIEAVPRAAISGAAGTGKTVLAIEEAVRCAENGARTLFLCYNTGLATHVRQRLTKAPPVAVMTFHELCKTLTVRVGLTPPSGIPQRQLFDDVWPELLMQAYDRLHKERYDAIIVDEGQDFLPLWWTAVQTGLASEGPGLLRVFYDDNQRLYASANGLPEEVDLIPIRLSLNLRNTLRIHELVRRHHVGHEVEAVGPEGVEVRWIRIKTQNQLRKAISDCVARLCSLDHMCPDDVVVLTPTYAEIEGVAPSNRLGGYRTVRCEQQSTGCIIVDSVRRFKGLERPVVVIAATGETVINEELPYVALSRARTYLVIVGTEKVLAAVARRSRGEQ